MHIVPIPIGRYLDAELEDLAVAKQVGRLVDVLAAFGGIHQRWECPADERDGTAVQLRLQDWESRLDPADAVLYWVGHGWSDGTSAALAHSRSPAEVRSYGILPEQVAEAVRGRQLRADGHWAMVIVDACRSDRFVELLSAELIGREVPDRVLLIGSSSGGAASLGRFVDALRHSLGHAFRGNRVIPLTSLAADLEGDLAGPTTWPIRLGKSALVRVTPPVAEWMSAPLDTVRHLEEVLESLGEDERRHFFVKAQGAEDGELSWFFEGRENEAAAIASWLQERAAGMLVVTGSAGSGKSALLGHVLVQSVPELRDALARRGLVPAVPATGRPPDRTFAQNIHLSGLTIPDIVRRIAIAQSLGLPPSVHDPTSGIATDLDWLASQLALKAADEPLTFLVDALDEATDPLDTARSVLARIAGLPRVRVVVGSRASTLEHPDHPTGDTNLLDALATIRVPGAEPPYTLVRVTRDPGAVTRYVMRRLREALSYGVRGARLPAVGVAEEDIVRVASAVAGKEREFLFARLAVYEILADPTLMRPQRKGSLGRLLDGDHRSLFVAALDRLGRSDDAFPALMQSLALARGRGVPVEGEVWSMMAEAVVTGSSPLRAAAAARPAITREQLHDLLDRAQAYVVVDVDNGQTVYRLAHRTFFEYFRGHDETSRSEARVRHRRATTRVLDNTEGVAGRHLSRYVTRHLSGHVADCGLWKGLAERPYVLDRLDPEAVTADALRTVFGRTEIEPSIAGIIGMKHRLMDAPPSDRAGLRHIAMTTHSPQSVIAERVSTWGIRAARVGKVGLHATFAGHTGIVNALTSVRFPDGRVVLVSGADDKTVRLWDPESGTPAGAPLLADGGAVNCTLDVPVGGHRHRVAAGYADGSLHLWEPWAATQTVAPVPAHDGALISLCSITDVHGRDVIASGGIDGTIRTWDRDSLRRRGPTLLGHRGTVWSMCVVRGADGPAHLVSGGADSTVRIWRPARESSPGVVVRAHVGAVRAVCALPMGKSATLFASAGDDGPIRIWDVADPTRPVRTLRGHVGAVWALREVHVPGRAPMLASAGIDGTVRLWDPATGAVAGTPLVGHTGTVRALTVIRTAAQQVLVATGGADGTVRLWDPSVASSTGAPAGNGADPGAVWGMCVAAGHSGTGPLLAAASNDGGVRLWDPVTATATGRVLSGHRGAVWGVCPVPDDGQPGDGEVRGARLASAGADGSIRIWSLDDSRPVGDPLVGHEGAVRSVCTVPAGAGSLRLLASAGGDGTVRLWDVGARRAYSPPLAGHVGAVWSVCSLRLPGGEAIVVSAGEDGTVRYWDPVVGRALRRPSVGHVGAVWGVRQIRIDGHSFVASVGADGTVRLWDPETGTPVGEPLTGHSGAVRAVCALPCETSGATVATAGADGTVRFWNPLDGGQCLHVLDGHVGTVRDVWTVSLNVERHLLVSAGIDGTVRLWGLPDLQPVGAPMDASGRSVHHLAEVGQGRQILVTGNGSARRWTPADAALHDEDVGSPPVLSIAAVERGDDAVDVLLGTVHDGVLVRGPSGAVESVGPTGGRRPMAILPVDDARGGSVVVGHDDGSLSVFHRRGRQPPVWVRPAHHGPVRALCALGDGPEQALASAGQDGMIHLWRLPRPATPLHSFAAHDGWIWDLCAVRGDTATTASHVASAGADGLVQIWELATRERTCCLSGHSDQVRSLVFLPDDTGTGVLITGGHDGYVRIWEPFQGTELHAIPLGLPLYALIPETDDDASRERTEGGVTLSVGTSRGILSLDLHRSYLR